MTERVQILSPKVTESSGAKYPRLTPRLDATLRYHCRECRDALYLRFLTTQTRPTHNPKRIRRAPQKTSQGSEGKKMPRPATTSTVAITRPPTPGLLAPLLCSLIWRLCSRQSEGCPPDADGVGPPGGTGAPHLGQYAEPAWSWAPHFEQYATPVAMLPRMSRNGSQLIRQRRVCHL